MSIKKLLTTLALLLPLAVMAQNQQAPHWTAPASNIYNDATVVRVLLKVNGTPLTINTPAELAAFIGDGDEETCRAYVYEATPHTATGGADPNGDEWILNVRGNKTADDTYPSDLGKTIKFRAFYNGIEYDFTKTVTFTGETYTPSPLELNLDVITGISLPETIEVTQPESAFPYDLDLMDYITLVFGDTTYTPKNESVMKSPIAYSWNAYNNPGVLSYLDNTLTILKPVAGEYYVSPSVTIGDPQEPSWSQSARTKLVVAIQAIPVTSITCDLTETTINAFEDFAAFIAPHIKVEPDNASNPGYSFNYSTTTPFDGTSFTAGGQYTIEIKPDDAAYTGTNPTVTVNVYVLPTNIGTDLQEALEVKIGDDVYTAIQRHQTLSWPNQIDPGQWGKSDVTYTLVNTPDDNGAIDATGTATAVGIARVKVSLNEGITQDATFQGQDNYTVIVNITSALEVWAEAGATEFVKNGTKVSENTPAIVYVKNPANEAFDPNDLEITFSDAYNDQGVIIPYAIQRSVVQGQTTAEGATTYEFRIQPLFTGTASFDVVYNGNMLTVGRITIIKEEELSAGWTWVSLSTNGGEVSKLFTQADIVEMRSQEDLLWNDANYGLVGFNYLSVLDGMYKVKTNKATKVNWGSGNAMEVLSGQQTGPKTIYPRYTWVNYPYQFELSLDRLSELFGGNNFAPADGDRIITQDGFAEYGANGWTSSNTFSLKEGQGLLYYSKSADNKRLTFPTDLMPDASILQAPAAPVKAFTHSVVDDILEYDVHAFADNMSMVAEVKGLDNPEDYTIGAFVDDECRGRGSMAVDGKMFISAVGTSGEDVTFRLVNNRTGQITSLEGTVSFGQIKGSLRAPVMLSIPTPTGVNSVNGTKVSNEAYDLSGRRIVGSQRGISIVRQADGSVRKVVTK